MSTGFCAAAHQNRRCGHVKRAVWEVNALDEKTAPDIQSMASATECTGLAPALAPKKERKKGGARARLKRAAQKGR